MGRLNHSKAIHASDTRVVEASVRFSQQPFVRPLVLSTGAIHVITQADATVRVVTAGVPSVGHGCIYLSDLWAWPDPQVPHEQRDALMRAYCQEMAGSLPEICAERAHPLVAGLQLHDHALDAACAETGPYPPALARCVCASIFDVAIHDAVANALECGLFELYDAPLAVAQADAYFGGSGGTFRAIADTLETTPRKQSPAWWIVGKADDLEQDVCPHVQRRGYFAFKLKIMGQCPRTDAARVVEVFRAARRWGIHQPRLTVDSNEANPDAQSVGAFLDELEAQDAEAFAALEMIEQPTGRDIDRHAFDWSAVASRKPVMVDEGLLSLRSMTVARQQHWSGFALKTCKGHSFALVAAAWAHQNDMQLSLQDLTNPGLSAVHAALFAAAVPTLNGVELNSPQFTPAANADWINRYPGLFQVRRGCHQLPDPASTMGLNG